MKDQDKKEFSNPRCPICGASMIGYPENGNTNWSCNRIDCNGFILGNKKHDKGHERDISSLH